METLDAHWVVHRPTPSSAGRMSKERRYFEGGELFTKTVAFPTLILVAHECILHFAANSVAFLCRIPPTMPKICTKSPIGAPLLAFSHPSFLCPPKSCHGNISPTFICCEPPPMHLMFEHERASSTRKKIDSPSAERRAIINRSALHVIGLIQAMI